MIESRESRVAKKRLPHSRLYFSEMARALFWPKRRKVLVMWAYFDESCKHNPLSGEATEVVVGGAIAPVAQWEILELRWRTALTVAGVTSFHMVDFAHLQNEFKGWEEDRRRNLMAALLEIIEAHTTKIIGSRSEIGTDTPFASAYLESAKDSVIYSIASADDELSVMFDKQEEVSAIRLDEYFKRQNLFSDVIGEIISGKSSRHAPLQAADLIAYEMMHWNTEPHLPSARYPLQELFRRKDYILI